METKICNKCGVEKEICFFSFRKRRYEMKALGICKDCTSKGSAEHRKKNLQKLKLYHAQWRKNSEQKIAEYKLLNKDRIAKTQKVYREKNKERDKDKKKAINKAYYYLNKEKISEQGKMYRKINFEKINKRRLRYRIKNVKKIKEGKRIHYINNKEKIKSKRGVYRTRKRATDPLYKLECNLRTRVWSAFRKQSYIKGGRTEDLLGAPCETVKAHIEKMFKSWMSWDNYGKWEVDHIIPLASAINELDLRNLCCYTNLQPLSKKDNRKKGVKILITTSERPDLKSE